MKKINIIIFMLSILFNSVFLKADPNTNISFKKDPWVFFLTNNKLITTLSLSMLPKISNDIGYFDLVRTTDGSYNGLNPIKERYDLKAGNSNDKDYIKSYYLPYKTNDSVSIKIPVNPTKIKESAKYLFTGALTGCSVIIAKAKVNPNNLITVFHDGRKCKSNNYNPNLDSYYKDYIILDYISFATYGILGGTQSAEVFMYFDNTISKWKMVYGIYNNEHVVEKGFIVDKEAKIINY